MLGKPISKIVPEDVVTFYQESVRATKRMYGAAFRRAHIEASLAERALLYLCVSSILFITLFPFYWMIVTSISDPGQLFQLPPSAIPRSFTFENYEILFEAQQVPFIWYFINSTIIAVISSFLAVAFTLFGAYSFARLSYPGRKFMARGVLVSYMIAGILMVVPIYQIVVWLGLLDTRTSLILTHFIFQIPLGLYLLGNYFRSIPDEIEEAAMIDGYSRPEVIVRITMPMSVPAIVAVYLYTFMLSWNEYLYAVIFLRSPEVYTLPIGIEFLLQEFRFPWGEVMAGSLLMTIPVAIMFIYLEKYMVEGLTFGSMD